MDSGLLHTVLYCLELWLVSLEAWSHLVAEGREHYSKIKCQVPAKYCSYVNGGAVMFSGMQALSDDYHCKTINMQTTDILHQAEFLSGNQTAL